MKDLLLLVRDDIGQPARLRAALDLATLLQARITCLEVDESMATEDDLAPSTIEGRMLQDVMLHQATSNRSCVERMFREKGVECNWTTVKGKIADSLSDHAAFHDLTLVNTQPRTYSWRDGSFVVSDLVRTTHQPVLLVPEEDGSSGFQGRAVVAWDGSPPCIAAMRAAVPLLSRAKTVSLIEVGEHHDGPTVQRAAAYLQNHDVHLHVDTIPGRRPADWLLSRCRPEHTSFCVMGAFGRSRGREAVFGGTTLDMLEGARVPLFVAH
ncbi:hypothetical protein [Sphingomonas sp. NPDC079357]|uniref:hypothetical protein n=1 Tax=Sphingomonas sp. NPDC079357 TaxID=3364518 RepID=UPI00384D0B37